jgi:hypothetical protein
MRFWYMGSSVRKRAYAASQSLVQQRHKTTGPRSAGFVYMGPLLLIWAAFLIQPRQHIQEKEKRPGRKPRHTQTNKNIYYTSRS